MVLAARGYPGAPEAGSEIGGLDAAAGEGLVFHAGTRVDGGRMLADGGRVLTLVGTGVDGGAARGAAYRAVAAVRWPEGFHRRDIGLRPGAG